jgi:hypothetical protein
MAPENHRIRASRFMISSLLVEVNTHNLTLPTYKSHAHHRQRCGHAEYSHPNTLRQGTNKGILKAYRVSQRGDRRFVLEDVLDLLEKLNSTGQSFQN